MSIPRPIDERIQYAISHAQTWQQVASSVGLDPSIPPALLALAEAAQDKRQEAINARADSVQATGVQDAAIEAMTNHLAQDILQIQAFAATQADPDQVYNTAQLPPPKTPTARKAPPAPTTLTGTFNNTTGNIELRWKNPSSEAFAGKTYFFIMRKLTEPVPGTGLPVTDWQRVGVSHDRDFIDDDVPAGYSQILYQVRATRNGMDSLDSEPIILKLGTPLDPPGEAGETGALGTSAANAPKKKSAA